MSQKSKKKGKNISQALRKCKINTDLQVTTEGSVIDNLYQPDHKKWHKLKQKVPVVFIHKPIEFPILQWHIKNILILSINIYDPYFSKNYVKLMCPTLNDQKLLLQYLERKQLPYHTFGHPAKRKMKVVIRGLPNNIDLDKVQLELKSLLIPVIRVHKMHIRNYENNSSSPILAVVPHDEEGKRILKVKKILNIDVTLEPPISKIQQCYRCQKWGHSQRYCHGIIKCVKCAGNHSYKKCNRNKTTEPPKCANCGSDHTANYKLCPNYPDIDKHKIKDQKRQLKAKSTVKKINELLTLENFINTYKTEESLDDFDLNI